ncbi:MAG: hypoxanthine phosphoribosyltransferase [Nitrospinaceae bacterium]|jgi:hypoxanthine phosphoribosyltransferase|nr:hypoxanthine phosphoribosyltransferase [Nitrospinaceae bacterium]MBT3435262.1 hypoxanthine phosphoribosyltransferase [Nitrospinaceae bacterium]MBT4094505.1 hypoxanthine phosphoribosyltransferase [Nitrospinaceae bacterium]MBT4429746.1 hypoxanthine phosphoribosyltransferase [Nitrospinaceae bacterium]MBT5367581.1 hypoxanthine phosphoribosyltransferase [Nitrospinaceae bacterium]
MPLGEIIFSNEQIQARVAALAGEINAKLRAENLHVILTLKGALFFGTDLIRAMNRELSVGFISASSYGGGTESSGQVQLRIRDAGEITGQQILIVEDIIDTGRTLETIVNAVGVQNPASVHTVAFIDKPARREVKFETDFTGFSVEDVFIVGYGLDYAEGWRSLPDIHAFKP